MNTLTGLIPILFAALQVVSRELIGAIPAASRDMRADGAALNQVIRVPVTPPSENQDITPGTPPNNGGTAFGYIDAMINKNRIAKPIQWTGDEEVSVGSNLNQMLVNQYAQAMRSLVNEVEQDLVAEAVVGIAGSGNIYGVAGTTPFATNLADLAQVKKIMDDAGGPQADRHLILNTSASANLRTLEKLTNVNQAGDNTLLRQGIILNLMGYDIRESAGFRILNPGAGSGYQLSSAVSAGATVLPVDTGTGAINKGAIITIGSGTERYVVTENVASGAGAGIPIAPALKFDYATASAVTIGAAYLPNVAFSRDSLLLLTRTPFMPEGGDEAKDVLVITDPVSNLSFQVALYGSYRQRRVEVGLAWGAKTVNASHGAVLIG